MDTNMFCFQCEQTAGCSGCTGKAGVCGKSAQTAQIQDQLTGALIGLAHAANGSLPEGQPIEKVKQDVERDYFMSAQEALDYHIIDEIYQPRDKAAK